MSSSKWRRVNLNQVSQIICGATPSTNVPEYWGDEIKWVTAKDVSESTGYKIYDTERKISTLGFENCSTKMIPKESTVLIARGATMGRSCMLGEDMAINQTCYAIVPNVEKVNPYFLFYSIKLLDSFFQKIAHGAIFNTVIGSGLRETEIALPPLSTQKRIAGILSAFDEKIELNRQTNATLEAIAQAIFREWFVNFNYPVLHYDLDDYMRTMRVGGENHSESGNQTNHSTDMVEGEMGLMPAGWRVGTLGDFGAIVCGKTPSKANSYFFGGQIPFIKIPDMHNSVFITQTIDSLTIEGAQSQNNKLLPPYSILVSCIATVGLVAITSELSQTNQQINSIIPDKQHYSFYLYFCAKDMEGILKDLGSGGSATLNVNTSTFSGINCLIPPETLLEKFDNVVRPLFDRILAYQRESTTLAQIRDALLPKLMRGEIV